MGVFALEGVVDCGLVRLPPNVHLPDKTKVYILVTASNDRKRPRVVSPRLAHPEQAVDFVMEVSEERDNASV
jgi:hypothetical protein